MPKLKITDDELDVNDLEDAEYEDRDFETYDGEQPPKGTVLRGYIKNVWYTFTKNDDPMLKVLFIADGNEGDEEQYNGLPVWENLALIRSVKFRWQPFFDTFGLSIRLVKTKTIIAEEDESQGAPIQKIGTWKPGEDARCKIITGREKYGENWNTKIGKWLSDEEPEDPEEDEFEEEEEEEPAPPPRTRKPTAKPATATRGTAAKATSRATAKPARPTRGRRQASAGYDDDPPF